MEKKKSLLLALGLILALTITLLAVTRYFYGISTSCNGGFLVETSRELTDEEYDYLQRELESAICGETHLVFNGVKMENLMAFKSKFELKTIFYNRLEYPPYLS